MWKSFGRENTVRGQSRSEAIFVDAAYSNDYKGIGTSLMGFMMRIARISGVEGIVLLEVEDPGFFDSLGFEFTGEGHDSMLFLFDESWLAKKKVGLPDIKITRRNNGDTDPASGDKGGIDFRALPIVTQPVPPNPSLVTGLSPSETAPDVNLDKEWQAIQNMLKGGMIPSSQRIKDYIQACCVRQDAEQQIDKVLSCIASILRVEEENCYETDSDIRRILVLLESNTSPEQMQRGLTGIEISAQEPEIIGY
jgi:hypothetical protein